MKTCHYILLLFLCSALSCSAPKDEPLAYLALTGATIIDGNGGEPIVDGVLLVKDGHVAAVGSRNSVDIPDRTETRDLSGLFIIPGVINGHGHVGDVKGIEGGRYSRE